MAAHHDHRDPALPDLETAAADLPLRLAFDTTVPRLQPVESGVRGALAAVLAAVVSTAGDDTWERMKICSADDCHWAFIDRSRNRSRTWCAMGVCGNRAKTRSYRARRRGATGDARGSHGDGA
jgi:predicted RNA-binding Zn ribbon-like protein